MTTLPPKPWIVKHLYASNPKETGESTTLILDATGTIILVVPNPTLAEYIVSKCNADPNQQWNKP